MNQAKAIELLRQSYAEVEQLQTLSLGNQEFELWRRKVLDILDVAFGTKSSEYERFVRAVTTTFSTSTEPQKKEEYDRRLKHYTTALKSILDKYEILGTDVNLTTLTSIPPKAFIAHGGRSGILDKLRDFVEALGIEPIIVELSPSRGMTVDEKVSKYIKDADCGIVLATKGGIVDTTRTKSKQHPRLNVIDELERLRAAFPEKTVLLVERGVDLPSNVSGLTYEPFVGQSMDRAFTAIARELTEFGIITATKPQE